MRSTRRRVFALTFLAIALLATTLALPDTLAAQRSPLGQSVDWLIAQQAEDGGFPGFDGETDPGASADAALALASAGVYPGEVASGGTSLLDYLESVAEDYSDSTGGAAKLLPAAVASGADPADFGGMDLIERATQGFDDATGLYTEQLYTDALIVLGLSGAGQDVPDAALDAILDRQHENGGWGFMVDAGSDDADLNTTAIVIQVLVATDRADEDVIDAALSFLEAGSAGDGSYMYAPGIEDPPVGDANTTALVLQARTALGIEDDTTDTIRDALMGFMNDSGAFRYQDAFPDDNLLATVQAIPALAGQSLPVAPLAAYTDLDTLQAAREHVEPGDETECDFFAVTGHNVCHGFRDFWHAGGGLPIFGYPLTEEFDIIVPGIGERITVQYFERVRFEYRWLNDEEQRLQVSPLGVPQSLELLLSESATDLLPGECETPTGAEFELCGPFLDYWNEYGSVERFGMPLSQAGEWNGLVIQQFEYARFEWHEGVWPERMDVLLGRIGAEDLRRLDE